MASDPITAVADAVTTLVGAAKPLLDQHLAQKFDNEYTETSHQIALAANLTDPARADALHDLCDKLCFDNGQTAGGLGDSYVRVRVSNVAALLTIAAAARRDQKKLAAAIAKLEK